MGDAQLEGELLVMLLDGFFCAAVAQPEDLEWVVGRPFWSAGGGGDDVAEVAEEGPSGEEGDEPARTTARGPRFQTGTLSLAFGTAAQRLESVWISPQVLGLGSCFAEPTHLALRAEG